MTATVFLTVADGSSWTVPSDWTSSNTIEVIAAGGGAHGSQAGGGGAYSKITNLALTAGASITIQVGTGGAGGSSGVTGGDTWFNGATLAASSVGAKGGVGATGVAGGLGGNANNGVGTIKFFGGNGGSSTASAAGGGGAAGPNGDGVVGSPGSGGTPNGGMGDAGFGGAGGIGVASGTGGAGGNGTEFNSTHGSGGGGGSSGATGGAGGNYGGGGGGGGVAGGAGADGLIIITYSSLGEQAGGWNRNTNIPARFGKLYTDASSVFSFRFTSSPPLQVYNWGFNNPVDYRFKKHLSPALQQFVSTRLDQPPSVVPTGTPGWQGDFRYKFAKPYPAGLQPFLGYFSADAVPTPDTPQGWDTKFDYQFAKSFSATEQQFSASRLDEPPSGLVPNDPGWAGQTYGVSQSFAIQLALDFSVLRYLVPTPDTVFWGYSAYDVVLMPLDPSQMVFSVLPFQTIAIPVVVSDQLGWVGNFGWQFAKPYSAAQQPIVGYVPQGAIASVDPTAPLSWVGDVGAKFVKPFAAALQQFTTSRLDQPPSVLPPAPASGWNVTPSYRFAKPFPVGEQQFFATRYTEPPTASTPQGWQTTFDTRFSQPVAAALQQFSVLRTTQPPSAKNPEGWEGYLPLLFAKPFPGFLQQFTGYQPRGLFGTQAPATVDPYIYPGDKKKKRDKQKSLEELLQTQGPYDPRKLTRKQRKRLAELEAQRWEQLTSAPSREEKLHADLQQAVAEVIAAAEKKRIEDAKVGGLFAPPPPVGLEASLHASINVVKELHRQAALDDARKALQRKKQEEQERAEREVKEALEREQAALKASIKAKKAQEDSRLLAKYRMKKKLEKSQVYDAVYSALRPTPMNLEERSEILDSVLDIARRRK